MISVCNYGTINSTVNNYDSAEMEQWIRDYAPGTFQAPNQTAPANPDVEEISNKIDRLTEQVALLASLLEQRGGTR